MDGFYDGLFPGADAAWIPTLMDVERRKADWHLENVIGWENLEVPDDCPNVKGRMDQLKIRFDERYASRRLGHETLEKWQMRLQNRFDEVVRRYDRMYLLYSRYDEKMKDDLIEGYIKDLTDSIKVKGSETGSSDSTGNDDTTRTPNLHTTTANDGVSKYTDSPDSRVNEGELYNGSTTRSDSTVTEDRTGTESTKNTTKGTVNVANENTEDTDRTYHEEHIVTGVGIVDSINRSVDSWQDVDTRLVAEFENLFLNIFWY